MDPKAKAAALFAKRQAAITKFVDTLEAITIERERLDQREHDAFTHLTDAGWSDKDLRELGVTKPKAVIIKPARAKRNTTTQAPQPAQEPREGGGHDEHH